MNKLEVINNESLWNDFNEDSFNEFMKYYNRGRQIYFLMDEGYEELFLGYCKDNYLYYTDTNEMIPCNRIVKWQWFEELPLSISSYL